MRAKRCGGVIRSATSAGIDPSTIGYKERFGFINLQTIFPGNGNPITTKACYA
jgi:hypothetical protein